MTAPAIALPPAGPALPWHWPVGDQALLGGLLTGQIGDWLSTIDIARRPGEYHELNPLLGAHPSVGTVNTYNALAGIGNVAIPSLLHPAARRDYLLIAGAVEAAMALRNRAIGLHFNAHF